MAGPIEFASAPVGVDDKGATEFGGVAGLVQPEPHEPDASEVRGMVVRAEAALTIDPVTGLVAVDEGSLPRDPVSGRLIEPSWVEDGRGVAPVDAPPRTGDARAAEL